MPAIGSKAEYRTSWACPYALVKWGGRTEGNRHQTRRMFINEAIAERGQIVAFRGFYCDANWQPSTKVRDIKPINILKDWRRAPLKKTYEQARRKLSA